jgi:hypothetical protein
VPLKLKNVKPMDVDALRRRMNEATQKRWDYLWSIAFPKDFQSTMRGEKERSLLATADALKALALDFAERVTPEMLEANPTRAYVIPFTVMQQLKTEEMWNSTEEVQTRRLDPMEEERERRLIHWPEQLNDYIKRVLKYKAQLEGMCHVSYFLQDLRFDRTTTGDLSVSFYQFLLTLEQMAYARFYDVEGNLYQWKRGLMGHVCFPEIMAIATAVISGDTALCKPEYSLVVPSRRVWIDNVKMSGSEEQMKIAGDFLDTTAAAVGATWNPKDRQTAVKHCVFVGGEWDHAQKTIRCSAKFRKKLYAIAPTTLNFVDSEKIVGRLVHAAGMLRLFLGDYYVVMKWYRRRCNAVRKDPTRMADQIPLPPCVRARLQTWLDDARKTVHVPDGGYGKKTAILFTDASLKGWGAILVLANGEVFVAGGSWSEKHTAPEINVLEARAVRNALQDFEALFRDKKEEIDALRIVIDNTSVKSSAVAGRAKEEELNNQVMHVLHLLKRTGLPTTFEYIPTDWNVADDVSRGRPVEWAKLDLAMGYVTGDGDARRAASRVIPFANNAISIPATSTS